MCIWRRYNHMLAREEGCLPGAHCVEWWVGLLFSINSEIKKYLHKILLFDFKLISNPSYINEESTEFCDIHFKFDGHKFWSITFQIYIYWRSNFLISPLFYIFFNWSRIWINSYNNIILQVSPMRSTCRFSIIYWTKHSISERRTYG